MKFTKVMLLLVVLVTATGAQAGWLDGLTGASQQPQSTAPATQENDWIGQLRGMLGQAQKPAAAPTQLGLPPVGSLQANAAEVGAVRQNIATMISKVQQMAPAITVAVTNKDFTSIAKLAEPAKDILSLGMSTAKDIYRTLAQNPQLKGVFTGLINQLTPVITPVASQIRSMSETAGWGKSFILRTIASGLEQVPQLLNQAAHVTVPEKG